jgi:hypothetical protein
MLKVAVGKRVEVAVGGNHTMVGVGVSVGGKGVFVGRGGGVNIGEQAARPARQNITARIANFIALVYYKCCKIRPQGSADGR